MAEAEDVIVDAARHATSYATELWRRHRVRRPEEARGVALADVRKRLELVIEAALGRSIPIRVATPPPPRTLISRWFARDARERSREALPGTDGTSIFLPSRIVADDGEDGLNVYRAAALQQALRCVRATAASFPAREPLPVQDLFLLSETVAAERDMTDLLPGLVHVLRNARRALLEQRPPLGNVPEPMRPVEALYRKVLSGEAAVPVAAAPADSLVWARRCAAASPTDSRTRYGGLAADALIGELVPLDAQPSRARELAGAFPSALRPRRTVRLARRPRVRQADEDEDDDRTGVWMVQSTPPNEHAEDPMGLQRPVDQQPDGDLEGAAESVSDLEALRLVSSPATSRESLVADDELHARTSVAPQAVGACSGAIAYPEWDHITQAYRPGAAIVRILNPADGSRAWVDATLAKHRATLTRVRRRFEALRSRRSVFRAQPDGEDIDVEACVHDYGDRLAGLPRADRLYIAQRPARRDFALLVLIDTSGSTESWVCADRRIIDIEKEALLIVSSALDALGVRFAIQAFSGHGPTDVRVRELKGFRESFNSTLARRISALEPDEYTRAGAALRHATATLAKEPAHRRLLLLLSDGKPNDCDRYEGRYGAEDMRQALGEARLQGISPFCVTVDRLATPQLAPIFGARNFTVVSDAPHLPAALIEWLRNVTVALA